MKPLLVLFTILALAGVADAQEKVPEYLIGSWGGEVSRGPEAHSVTIAIQSDGTWKSIVAPSGRFMGAGQVFASGSMKEDPFGEIILEGKNNGGPPAVIGHKVEYRLRIVDGKLAGKFTSGIGGEFNATLTKGK